VAGFGKSQIHETFDARSKLEEFYDMVVTFDSRRRLLLVAKYGSAEFVMYRIGLPFPGLDLLPSLYSVRHMIVLCSKIDPDSAGTLPFSSVATNEVQARWQGLF